MKNKLKTVIVAFVMTVFAFVSGCDLVEELIGDDYYDGEMNDPSYEGTDPDEEIEETDEPVEGSDGGLLDNIYPGEYYYERDDVAGYIYLYKDLPNNYITKQEADDIGWEVGDGSVYVIGGDHFGNYEGLLPEAEGREYFEADLAEGYTTHRGPLRLVFSNDGLIFYTEDHYDSFEQLYGGD